MRESLILVPIDLSPLGEAKLPVVEHYARLMHANVLLLHVLPSGSLDPSAVSPSEATARTYLDTVAARLRNAGLRAEGLLRSGPPAATIVSEAEARGVDLIILGANIRPTLPGAELPPIDVYKLGFGYYVLDGHHRLAAALHNGQLEIDASVTEFLPAADEQAPELFAARRNFELATGLTDIGATRPETYVTLQHVIETYRQEQGLGELKLAANRWQSQVYRPLWQAIRARQLAAVFPGDRTADVVARLAAWRDVEAPHLDWLAALEAFADQTASVSSR